MTSYSEVSIDLREVHDWSSFHATFSQKMGFPDFYGQNMNAWIDCMSSVDAPDERMTTVHAPENGILVLILHSVRDFKTRCPEILDALIDCLAFVNFRRMEQGDAPVLSISYHD
jgi:RNAse (barnase) inhibitor barstar